MKTVLSKIVVCYLSICLVLMTFQGCSTLPKKEGEAAGNTEISKSTEAAVVLGIFGALAGAAIGGKKNPLLGAAAGLAAGSLIGYTLGEICDRTAKEAARTNKEVTYDDGQGRIVTAKPINTPPFLNPVSMSAAPSKCKKVLYKVVENDVVIEEKIKNVCEP
jgi:hypothetical protein